MAYVQATFRGQLFRRLSIPVILLMAAIVLGITGYYLMWRDQGGTLSDALYMTFITITTIGYGEVYPLDHSERLFTMGVSIVGIGSLFYVIGTTMEHVVARQVSDVRGRRKMREAIKTMSQHIIVAGLGQMGKQVARELYDQEQAFVIVDLDEHNEDYAKEHSYRYVLGDASEEDTLLDAGVMRARGLIATADNDASNAFIIMTARSLKADLSIVVRAENDTAHKKLLRAGADQVINPYVIGSRRIVNQVLRPALVSLMEMNPANGEDALRIEELEVRSGSSLADYTLRHLDLRNRCGVNVVAVIRASKIISPPDPDMQLVANDHLLVLGTQKQFEKLEQIEITDADIISS
ncbi:MAG: potassium channel protein [Deinococcota bacterium]